MSDDPWCLIFSDGTGQRGVREEAAADQGLVVKNTNVFQLYMAADSTGHLRCFYDPGLGAPEDGKSTLGDRLRNLWAKATGWGISDNIADCYDAILRLWEPGVKIGLFGFSRGAYTARCVGGVLSTCGIATRLPDGKPIPRDETGEGARARRRVAEQAVSAYTIRGKAERSEAGAAFRQRHGSIDRLPDAVGVFDTVKSLGLPGITDIVNPWRHRFHDTKLASRVPVALHALSIDENRKSFLPVLWDEPDADALAAGQVIEQVWFPGVHSDIGGGYADDSRLADLTLAWMLARLEALAGLHIPMRVAIDRNLSGAQHDERTGLGVFWLPAMRAIRGLSRDVDALCADIEHRFTEMTAYRPPGLSAHPRVSSFYSRQP